MPELIHALNATYRLASAGGLAALLASAIVTVIAMPAKAQDTNGALATMRRPPDIRWNPTKCQPRRLHRAAGPGLI
jgi:hypothetical protein